MIRLSLSVRRYTAPAWTFRGLDIEFLGTGSCTPTAFRNVACTAVRLASQNWLFDCGEGTQLQVSRSNCITSSKINRICLTHRHGDHVFGLPSLIQTIAGDASEASVSLTDEGEFRDIEVIGPIGTASFLNAALSFTGAKIKSRVVVVELSSEERAVSRVSSSIFVRSVKPNANGVWELGPGDGMPDGPLLFAARIRHTAPCWGYLVVEPDVPGNIDVSKMQALGIPPSPVYKTIKEGGALLLKDGTVVRPEDVVTPATRGRRVAILGDTDSAYGSAHLFQNADVLVHDCTLPRGMEDMKSRSTGHSGPRIAGEFAAHISAGHLFLSHIGRRMGFMRASDELRRAASTAMGSANVTVANDFDVYSVNSPNDFDKLGVVSKRATRADTILADVDAAVQTFAGDTADATHNNSNT